MRTRSAGKLSWIVGVTLVAGVLSGDRARAEEPSEEEPYTVAVVSDMNGSYGSTAYGETVHETVDWLAGTLQPDLVVSTGDHVAGQKPGLDYAAMWDAFHRAVTEPLAEAGIPFAPTPGNHDASAAPRYDRERDRFVREWRERRPQVEFVAAEHFPLRYAFRAGPALFVSIDATMPGELPDTQYEWLAGVLHDHADATTKIVYGHLPLVPFARGKENEALESERLSNLLAETGVDVMLSGHHHAYYPGQRGDLRLVGLGCLGAGPRRLIGRDERSRQSAVVLELYDDGRVTVDAYAGEGMEERIPRHTLPRSIGRGKWTVWRDDVVPFRQRLTVKER